MNVSWQLFLSRAIRLKRAEAKPTGLPFNVFSKVVLSSVVILEFTESNDAGMGVPQQ